MTRTKCELGQRRMQMLKKTPTLFTNDHSYQKSQNNNENRGFLNQKPHTGEQPKQTNKKQLVVLTAKENGVRH